MKVLILTLGNFFCKIDLTVSLPTVTYTLQPACSPIEIAAWQTL